MKNNRNLFLIATLAIFMLTSCSTETEKTTVETTEAKQEASTEDLSLVPVAINAEESTITWNGYKSILDTEHEGTIDITDGILSLSNGEIAGGSFTLDMTSINLNDLDGRSKSGLENHLNSAEFFDTTNFTEAEFTITQATPIQEESYTHEISGNLTLKDTTKNITFKSNIQGLENQEITVSADFNIDRQLWNIGHSDDQSILDEVKDNALQNEIRIRLDLQS